MKNEFETINKLYHFTKFDTAKKILESKTIRFSRLNSMNDIHENDKLAYVDLNRQNIKDFPNSLIDIIEDEIYKYRQISFTEDSSRGNKLGFDLHQMWGLYADKGHGVCFVFDKDILESKLSNEVAGHQVSYQTEVNSILISLSTNPGEIPDEIRNNRYNIFFHKRKEWEHENEYRLIKQCPNTKKEEYLEYGTALKYIILSSCVKDKDVAFYNKMITDIQKITKIPILEYGNGLLDYSLSDIEGTEVIWTASEGYNVLVPGKNCDIDCNDNEIR